MSQRLEKRPFERELLKYQGELNILQRRASRRGGVDDPGVRRLGRRGQGRRDPPHHGGARRARLPGDPDRRADRRGARASLPVAVLAASAARRPRHDLRSHPGTAACWSSASRASRREAEWTRAYAEINEFEEQLVDHGIVLVKFWIHITKDEQLRRFKDRERLGVQALEDHRRGLAQPREVGRLRAAVNDMVERTSTRQAPWTLVEANDKYYARIRILQTACDRLRQSL